MYDKQLLSELLRETDFRNIDDNECLYRPSHAIYQTISDRMRERGSEISAKHVSTILKEDRNRFRSIVLEKWGMTMVSSVNSKMNDTVSSVDTLGNFMNCTDNAYEHVRTSVTKEEKKIELIFLSEKYKKMKPEKKFYGERGFWKFRTGWTDIIADAVRQQHNIDCVLSFKNNLVRPNNTTHNYAKFKGVCIECKATIEGTMKKEPENDHDAIVQCRVRDIVSRLQTGKKKAIRR